MVYNLKRRDFMKMIGIAVAAPVALLKAEPKALTHPNIRPYYTGGIVNTEKIDSTSLLDGKVETIRIFVGKKLPDNEIRIEQTYLRYKITAIKADEIAFLLYNRIKPRNEKPLINIRTFQDEMKYVYLPIDEIENSDIPLPRSYVEFETEQPLRVGDLFNITNDYDRTSMNYIVYEAFIVTDKVSATYPDDKGEWHHFVALIPEHKAMILFVDGKLFEYNESSMETDLAFTGEQEIFPGSLQIEKVKDGIIERFWFRNNDRT